MKGLTKNSYSPKAENKNDYFEDAASDKKVIRDVQLEINSGATSKMMSTHCNNRDDLSPKEGINKDYEPVENSDMHALQPSLITTKHDGLQNPNLESLEKSYHKVHIEIIKQSKGKENQKEEKVELTDYSDKKKKKSLQNRGRKLFQTDKSLAKKKANRPSKTQYESVVSKSDTEQLMESQRDSIRGSSQLSIGTGQQIMMFEEIDRESIQKGLEQINVEAKTQMEKGEIELIAKDN